MNKNLLPADTYTVVNQTILTEIDKKNIISLYEPIIGPIAVSLYLTLWSDLDKLELISRDYTHHHLMTILKSDLKSIENARKSLEAVGLLKSYLSLGESINKYLYELYSPLSAYEFFSHPILSVLLLNNIGDSEYNSLIAYYKKIRINKEGYEEITQTMNQTFKSVTPDLSELDGVRKHNKLGVNLENLIDFELVEAHLPRGIVNPKTFNKKTKELVNQLAFIYNIDSLKMSEIISLVIDEVGSINKEKLRDAVRKNYEYNNNGRLPTIIYRTQPDHLKTPLGDSSPRGKMIYVFENTKPYDFLRGKNKGVKPTAKDLKLLEHIAVDFELPPGVINVLVDYALRMSDGKLNQKYLETIATDWSRKGVKTVTEAMEVAMKKHNKNVKSVSTSSKKQIEVKLPSWMGVEQQREELPTEEKQDLEEFFKEFR